MYLVCQEEVIFTKRNEFVTSVLESFDQLVYEDKIAQNVNLMLILKEAAGRQEAEKGSSTRNTIRGRKKAHHCPVFSTVPWWS